MNISSFLMASSFAFYRNRIGELNKRSGIVIQLSRLAPCRKRFRVDEDAKNGIPGFLESAFLSLCFDKPFIKASWKMVAINHDLEDGIVIS